MPKIFNTSWLAVILATVVYFFIGFLWYGFLFEAQWLEAAGMTAEQADTMMQAKGPMMFAWGLLLPLAQALGLLWVINLAGAKRLPKSLSIAFWLFLMIAGPLMAYNCLYGDYGLNGILIDYGYVLISYLAMAAIYAMFRGKDAIDA